MTAPAARGTPAAVAAVVGFFAAAVLPRATWPLIDGDVWWHIRAGEEVIRTGRVPSVDTWSLVGDGRSWTSQDWLANVLLAAGNSLGPWGQTLLSFLFGAFTVAAFWILWRAMAVRAPGIGWASRVLWLSVGLVLAGPVMGVRVQVLDLLMATAVVWVLWRYPADPRRRWLLALPFIAAVWANLHAGWVLLFLLGGAVVLWVAGFDVLYALQDLDFDRRSGLYSIPARMGVAGALWISGLLHVVMLGLLAALPWVYPPGLGAAYWAGLAGCLLMIGYQHAIVRPGDLSRLNAAFFTANGALSLWLFAATAVDLLRR